MRNNIKREDSTKVNRIPALMIVSGGNKITGYDISEGVFIKRDDTFLDKGCYKEEQEV
jgi:hypothetical protein